MRHPNKSIKYNNVKNIPVGISQRFPSGECQNCLHWCGWQPQQKIKKQKRKDCHIKVEERVQHAMHGDFLYIVVTAFQDLSMYPIAAIKQKHRHDALPDVK